MSNQRPKRGFSLIEMVVTIGLLSLILTGVYQIFNEGLRYYRTNQQAAEAQLAILQVLSKITSEISVSKASLCRNYPETSGSSGDPSGIVFASAAMNNGKVRFHEQTGQVYWQYWVCYFFEPDPSGGTNGKVYRARESIHPSDSSGEGNINLAGVVIPGLQSKTTSHFMGVSAYQPRLISDNISALEITQFDGNVDELGGTSSSQAVRLIYNVRVASGDDSPSAAREYFVEVESRVAPLN